MIYIYFLQNWKPFVALFVDDTPAGTCLDHLGNGRGVGNKIYELTKTQHYQFQHFVGLCSLAGYVLN